MLEVRSPGVLATVQDLGRPGWAHVGVPRGGALDAPAAALANRLVGNPSEAAVVETTLGGLEVVLAAGRWVAVTGAPCPVLVDGVARAAGRPEWLPAGARLALGVPATGVRSYLAVAGGVDVAPVLGSRSTDTLAGVGPPPLRAGDELALGTPVGPPVPLDTPVVRRPGPLRVVPGPRADWFAGDPVAALAHLCAQEWTVRPESDRVGLRLAGVPLERAEAVRAVELPSEGMVLGAVQVPPDGQPIVFLADHPPTGGYPVVAVVEAADLWRCAQLRPGEPVAFRPAPGATTG